MATAIMPMRQSNQAPSWDGSSSSLKDFFEEFDMLATNCKVDAADNIKYAKRYIPEEHRELWDSLWNELKNWDKFKAKVLALHPGSECKGRYDVRGLSDVARSYAVCGSYSLETLAAFYRVFITMAKALKDEQRIDDNTIHDLFELSFVPSLRDKIRSQLYLNRLQAMTAAAAAAAPIGAPAGPAVVPLTTDAYPVQEAYEAYEFVLRDELRRQMQPVHGSLSIGSVATVAPYIYDYGRVAVQDGRLVSASQTAPPPPAAAPPLKTESTVKLEDSIAAIAQGFAQLTKRIADLERPPPQPPRFQDRGFVRQNLFDPNVDRVAQRIGNCHFCHGPHFKGECELLQLYRSMGLVENYGTRVELPDNARLPFIGGGASIRDQVDAHYRQKDASYRPPRLQSLPGPPQQGNLFTNAQCSFGHGHGVALNLDHSRSHASTSDSTLTSPAAIALLQQQLAEAQFALDEARGVRTRAQAAAGQGEQEARTTFRPRRLQPEVVIETRRPVPPRAPSPVVPVAPGSPVASPPPPPQRQAPPHMEPTDLGATSSLRGVLVKALEQPVVKLSLRELIALAPSTLRLCLEALQAPFAAGTHPEPVHSLDGTPLHAEMVNLVREQRVPSALDSLPVRIIPIVMTASNGDKITVDAILDPGASVVCLRSDIWERLGSAPMAADDRITMEAANSTSTRSEGVVRNLPAKLGEIDLRLNVHVFEDAPYAMLLGRPFFAYIRSQLLDVDENTVHLIATDPHTGKSFRFATRPRPRECHCSRCQSQGAPASPEPADF